MVPFEVKLSIVPMPLKKGATVEMPVGRFPQRGLVIPISLHTSFPGNWKIPMGPWERQRGGYELLLANVLSYQGDQRKWEPVAEAVGKPNPGFYVSVAESEGK